MDVGVVVQNVATAAAVYDAVRFGRPLIERIVTISGSGVNNPGNFRVRTGTSSLKLIEAAGGFKSEIGKVISGGPYDGYDPIYPGCARHKGDVRASVPSTERSKKLCI